MAKNTKKDQLILQLQSQIKAKKETIEKTSKTSYKSKLIINIPGTGFTINIHTLNKDSGVSVLATLLNYKDALEKAISLLPNCNKTTEEVDAWIHDVILKMEILLKNEILSSLEKDEKELEELLSDDFKKEKKLESILSKYA